jgi:hypothetical protein
MVIGAVSFGVVQRTNWYPYAPAWWLVSQVAPPGTNRMDDAWAELMRREARGELSAAARSPLIRVCLAAQTDEQEGPLLDRQLDYLGQCFGRGLLSQAQSDWFFSRMVKMELKVRPRVRQGDPLAWAIETKTRMPAEFMLVFGGRLRCSSGIVNDASMEGSIEVHVTKGGRSTQSRDVRYRCMAPGRQKVSLAGTGEIRAQINAFRAVAAIKPGQLYYSEPITLRAEFEVVPADTQDVRKVADESLHAALQKQIRPPSLRLDRSAKLPAGKVRIMMADSGGWNGSPGPPMDLAFEILARTAGQEHRLGWMLVRKSGDPAYLWDFSHEGPAVQTVDVILRSSAETARKTTDITEIWDGELVYPNVPCR